MSEIIPSLNCPEDGIACIQERLAQVVQFAQWVHLDIADGVFTAPRSWGDAAQWPSFKSPLKLEVHLMAEHPDTLIDAWLEAGAQRIIVHVEAIERAGGTSAFEYLSAIREKCRAAHAELMLAVNPDTSEQALLPYASLCDSFQILAVHPGPAHQPMLPGMPEKVQRLHDALPSATIEVDGGIVPATAHAVKSAGAQILIAGSYTLGSDNPAAASEELKNV